MASIFMSAVYSFAFASACLAPGQQFSGDLMGGWQAISIERGRVQAPPELVKLMKMTFRKDEVLIRGNFQDEREVSCKYKLNTKANPIHFDFTPPGEKNPVLGIIRIHAGKLEVCIRNANNPKGRPEKFSTTEGGDSIVMMRLERIDESKK